MLAKQPLSLRQKIRRWIDQFILITLVFLTCCYVYAKKIEPNWIEVVPIQLAIPHLAPAFDDFKIVQISDLHASKFMPPQRLTKIIELVNQQQPDAIAITGDLITQGHGFDADQLSLNLKQLKSELGTLAVLGNHDHWWKTRDQLKQTLIESKITILENQVFIVERDSQKLAFAGLDDPYWGHPNLPQIIAQLPEQATAILLVHEPDYIEKSAKTHKFSLQLSGHSHGGQIRIPFLTPLVLPYGGKKYFAGLNQVEDTFTYTNRGLGMTGLPLRFGSRPEVTVFTLHPTS
ncbi:MAG: metallophosphoesterase [Cyanobacteria bacterium P01_G01_bin.67]